MVAVPRDDFPCTPSRRTASRSPWRLDLAAGTTVIGLSVLSTDRNNCSSLPRAARRIGDGDMSTAGRGTPRRAGRTGTPALPMQTRLPMTDAHGPGQPRCAAAPHRRARQPPAPPAWDARRVLRCSSSTSTSSKPSTTGWATTWATVKEVSQQRLQETPCAKQDLVARYAGDEFVALIDSVDSRRGPRPLRDQLRRVLAGAASLADTTMHPRTLAVPWAWHSSGRRPGLRHPAQARGRGHVRRKPDIDEPRPVSRRLTRAGLEAIPEGARLLAALSRSRLRRAGGGPGARPKSTTSAGERRFASP